MKPANDRLVASQRRRAAMDADLNDALRLPSKRDLRDMLAQAVVNTAAPKREPSA